MKRLKIISSFLIFIMCMGVLCTGVYSASLINVQITGNLSILPKVIMDSLNINTNNLNVSISYSVENATTSPTGTTTSSGILEVGELNFSEDTFCGQQRFETINIKVLITNGELEPIRAGAYYEVGSEHNYAVVGYSIDNSYIAPGETGEVSLQLCLEYDRNTETPTPVAFSDYIWNLTVMKLEEPEWELQSPLSQVNYDATGIAGGQFNYYVNFGNPDGQADDLRWFIFAKEGDNGEAVPLADGVDYDSSTDTFIGGNTYYLVSEYVLDSYETPNGISFQNEIGTDYCNPAGEMASDYASSNYRKYLNGATIKTSYYQDSSGNVLANGYNHNFVYCTYVNDSEWDLFYQIKPRSLSDLYSNSESFGSLPESYSGQADKFWALSMSEYSILTNGDYSNGITYSLSGRWYYQASNWWLRDSHSDGIVACVTYTGAPYVFDAWLEFGVRPAFALEI